MIKTFNATITLNRVPAIRQTGQAAFSMMLEGKTAKSALTARVKAKYAGTEVIKSAVITEVVKGTWEVTFNGEVIMIVSVVEMEYMEALEARHRSLDDLEAHKPVALVGELMIASFPKQR